MTSKPTDPNALSVTMTKDGTITLTGVNYNDLRSILTKASLYLYDHKVKVERLGGDGYDSLIHRCNVDNAQMELWQRTLIDLLSGHLYEAMQPGCPEGSRRIADTLKMHSIYSATLEEEVIMAEAEAAREQTTKQEGAVDRLANVEKQLQEMANAIKRTMTDVAEMRKDVSAK